MVSQVNVKCDFGKGVSEDIYARYGESGRVVSFKFVNSNMDGEVVEVSNARFCLVKSDGNFVIQDFDNSVGLDLTSNMCASSGVGSYEVQVNIDGVVVSGRGSFIVSDRVWNDEVVKSVSEGNGLVFPDDFQEKLIAGDGIEIEGNVIRWNGIEVEDKINSLEEYVGIPYIVGSEFDFKNRTFTRLASSVGLSGGDDFDKFPQYNLRRCNLANDGTVNAYYGDSNYIEDGSNGQVMVEIPRFYYRVEPIELGKAARGYHLRKAKYYISPYPVPGFKIHPAFILPDGRILDKFYYSAYEGCLYDTSASAYVTNDSGVMDTSVDLLSSIFGVKPASGNSQALNKTNLEKLATNRGDGWHLSTIKAEMAITMLMMVEYNTLNFQSVIGNGVISITDDESSNLAVVTGATSSLGNKTGMASGTNGLVSISYRGIENPYANIWKNINGINIWGDGTMQGGEIFIANDFNFNESSHSDNYEEVGFYLTNSDGWINAFGYSKEEFDWLLMPSEVGGNSALPIGDYTWITPNLNGYRITLLGGSWNVGLFCGRSFWRCSNGIGHRLRNVGGRVLYFGKM